MAAQFTWNATVSGGFWNTAADWTDLGTGQTAAVPPGPADTAMVSGQTVTQFPILTGNGSVASLQFLGNTALEGQFATVRRSRQITSARSHPAGTCM